MPTDPESLSAIRTAIEAVELVRGVSELRALDGDTGTVVVTRVGLSPLLRLPDIVYVISEVDSAVRDADRRVVRVFVEPDIAADSTTPTEAIVIRSLD